MTRVGRWLAETRAGRATFLLSVLLLIGAALYMAINLEVTRQTRSITRRVEVIERVQPIDVVRACLRAPKCRHLVAAHPKLPGAEGGDAVQSPSKGGQQPGPPKGGHHGGSKGGGPPKLPPNVAPSAPPVNSSPENVTPTTGKPGNNGKGNGPIGKAVGQVGEAANGVVDDVHGKACPLLEAC